MKMSDVLRNARLYMAYWADKRDKMDGSNLTTFVLDYDEDLQKFNLANSGAADKKAIRGIPKTLLEAAFEEFIIMIPKKLRALLAPTIVCTGETLEPLKIWVKAVTGKTEADDVHIMAHWLWLVKRNALGLPVVHHIMPIVTSPRQGGGKSTAVRYLYGPLEKLALEQKVPQVVDDRSYTMYSNYLIVFLDEMAGADKVEIADFKRNVTSSTLTYRPMRTNTQVKIDNICSFIGSSNNQLFDIIKDTTGVRRFFQIEALDLLDQDTINTIEYMKIWQGIDENRPRGYFEDVKDIVAQKQDSMSMKDEVQLFVEEYHVLPIDENIKTINGKQLYNEYIFHTKNAGIRFPVARQTFYKKLQSMGLQGIKKADEKSIMCWFFAVNSKCVASLQKEGYDS